MTGRRIPTDTNLFALPAGLPSPSDDGAAKHLRGMQVPSARLPSTSGELVDVGVAAQRLTVFFVYPATIAPPAIIPGEWSEVPGARGCTIQNLGFRDAYSHLQAVGCGVFGVSGQGLEDPSQALREQKELKARLDLPFDLLNDSAFILADALRLPTFVVRLRNPRVEHEGRSVMFPLQGKRLLKRLTFITVAGRIEKVFYPVFPPDLNAREVLAYLHARKGRGRMEAR